MPVFQAHIVQVANGNRAASSLVNIGDMSVPQRLMENGGDIELDPQECGSESIVDPTVKVPMLRFKIVVTRHSFADHFVSQESVWQRIIERIRDTPASEIVGHLVPAAGMRVCVTIFQCGGTN